MTVPRTGRAYCAATTPKGERPRFAFNPAVLTAWIGKGLWQRIRGKWHRYGYACVSFGQPFSLRGYVAERGIDFRSLPEQQRFSEIERLGQHLMAEVGRVVPALPVTLVASAILAAGERGLSSLELKGSVFELMRRLQAAGAHVHIPRHDQEYAVDVGLRMLMLAISSARRHLSGEPKETALLAFYAMHRPSAAGIGARCGRVNPV
jgi:glycerol-3-phosphate O-acyltransferase